MRLRCFRRPFKPSSDFESLIWLDWFQRWGTVIEKEYHFSVGFVVRHIGAIYATADDLSPKSHWNVTSNKRLTAEMKASPSGNVFRTLELTDTHTNLANQVEVGHALNQSRSVHSCGPERARQTMSGHADRRRQVADFRDSFETINWLYLLFKYGIKTKTHFEWLLWHWSSLGQLNLEPTRPDGLVGCKVPTDLVKISKRSQAHGFLLYKRLIQLCRRSKFIIIIQHRTSWKLLVLGCMIKSPFRTTHVVIMWIYRILNKIASVIHTEKDSTYFSMVSDSIGMSWWWCLVVAGCVGLHWPWQLSTSTVALGRPMGYNHGSLSNRRTWEMCRTNREISPKQW